MMNIGHVFTSESVAEGHPDKVCDQIADAVLDTCLREDTNSRVACEAFATTGMVLVGGEISTKAQFSIDDLVRSVVADIGYTDASYGLDGASMAVISTIHRQSPEIAQKVDRNDGQHKELGAGDQGMMFGYACDETEELMPAPIMLSHKLMMQVRLVRRQHTLDWLRPDGKSQVTVEYQGQQVRRIATVVLSQQHSPDVSRAEMQEALMELVVKPVLEPTGFLDTKTEYIINPAGQFSIGGPYADTGLTGRKIIVDTYGGMGRHGGGSFSGKDPTKVDRSGAYMARYIAKNLVASKACRRCEVQLAYAIGLSQPISVRVDTFGTASVDEHALSQVITRTFDLSPGGIISHLNLLQPIYQKTAAYGHFGRDSFSWEQTDKVDALRASL